jgi:hypothetical protein
MEKKKIVSKQNKTKQKIFFNSIPMILLLPRPPLCNSIHMPCSIRDLYFCFYFYFLFTFQYTVLVISFCFTFFLSSSLPFYSIPIKLVHSAKLHSIPQPFLPQKNYTVNWRKHLPFFLPSLV